MYYISNRLRWKYMASFECDVDRPILRKYSRTLCWQQEAQLESHQGYEGAKLFLIWFLCKMDWLAAVKSSWLNWLYASKGQVMTSMGDKLLLIV